MTELGRIARIIEKHVGYFNGWSVDDETMKKNCATAANDILKYLKRRIAQRKWPPPMAQGAGK